MQFDRRKSKSATVSLILLIAMTVSLVALPTANAQDTRKTYPFIGAVPNPVGVNQEVLLHVGITHPLYNTADGWEGLTVTVTRPDGVVETLGPYRTDSTGGTGGVYVPTMAGNYTLQTHFPEQVNPRRVTRVSPPTPTGCVMLASDSDIVTLVVQEEPIQYYPAHALPTEYWTRPIDPQIREWYTIAGNWLDTNRRNPQFVTGNDDAPETAHVLWTKQVTSGGLVGDPRGEHSYEMGDAYEGKFANRLIMGGKFYFGKYASPEPYQEIVCVDLHTGEELWSKVFPGNDTISYGQLMYWDTYDYHGTYDYLWTTDSDGWHAWDAYTGDWMYTMYDVPSGTQVYGPKGEFLRYNINLGRGYMTLWNSTAVIDLYQSTNYAGNMMAWGQWRPFRKTVNASGTTAVTPSTPFGINGLQWNVSIAGNLGSRSLPGSVRAVYPENKAIGSTYSNDEVTHWGISLEPGKEGTLLFNKTVAAPAAWRTGNVTVQYQTRSEDVFVYWTVETRKFYGFSAETGDYLWETAESQQYLNFYGLTSERPAVIAYGKLFSSGTAGIVYCYDIASGELLWEYHATDYYSEILWANDWWLFPVFVTDGKIYYGHLEHSPIDPRPRGGPFVCLNVTNGEVIFRADGLFRQTLWGGLAIIGDSIIATQDTYDTRIYGVGKGPSATTVSAGPKVSVHGDSVVVEGMVTDISPGTQEYARTARFPNGVPAVSDEDMSDWMLYVYKQFARPADAVGVEVVVEVLDPNNNFYEVARATSDAGGYFGCEFTPEVPGLYKIIATFEGSKAYYGSYAETFVNVEEAPAATPPPTPTPAPMTDTYILGSTAGIIIAIVVIGLLIILMFRRR